MTRIYYPQLSLLCTRMPLPDETSWFSLLGAERLLGKRAGNSPDPLGYQAPCVWCQPEKKGWRDWAVRRPEVREFGAPFQLTVSPPGLCLSAAGVRQPHRPGAASHCRAQSPCSLTTWEPILGAEGWGPLPRDSSRSTDSYSGCSQVGLIPHHSHSHSLTLL